MQQDYVMLPADELNSLRRRVIALEKSVKFLQNEIRRIDTKKVYIENDQGLRCTECFTTVSAQSAKIISHRNGTFCPECFNIHSLTT